MIFMAKARRLRVVLKPTFHILDATGQRVQIPGKTIEFMGGRFETDDNETIAQMLNHDYCGGKKGGAGCQFTPVEDEQEWKEQHPEYFHAPVQMITGAMATVNSAEQPLAKSATFNIPVKKTEPVINIEEIIDKRISEKFDSLSAKLDVLLNKEMEAKKLTPIKPKRTFTCPVPGCGQVFKSPFDVGAHKKLAHVSLATEL